MPVTPPVSPKTCIKHGKKSRRSSQSTLSVEELTPDDMGYDGDVETLRPSEYEDVDSDVEGDVEEDIRPGSKTLTRPDVDGELAGRMRQLSWRQTKPTSRLTSEHNRSHNPRDNHSLPNHVNQYGKREEIEIAEVREGRESPRPAKRQRKRSATSSPTKSSLQSRLGVVGDASDHSESGSMPTFMETTESTGVSEAGNGPQDEAMEVD